MRTACVKSLSSEFCPGREGPLLFGDPENGAYPEIPFLVSSIDQVFAGYALAYLFKLQDLQARGGVRWYGLMFMHQSIHLLVNWDHITR